MNYIRKEDSLIGRIHTESISFTLNEISSSSVCSGISKKESRLLPLGEILESRLW